MDVFFTPYQALELQAGYYGVPKSERRSEEILAALGLADKRDAYVRQLSGGMKRRLLIAKALVHNPPVLILDEPTAGVDIELRRQLWEYVEELHTRGTTIILTTHYLEEAEALCDRIAIMHHGEIVAINFCDAQSSEVSRLVYFGFTDRRARLRGRFPLSNLWSGRIEAVHKSGNLITAHYL